MSDDHTSTQQHNTHSDKHDLASLLPLPPHEVVHARYAEDTGKWHVRVRRLAPSADGGEEFERVEDPTRDGSTVSQMRGGEGRMCLPPMLLHPVKDVELPVEENPEGELEIPESDPGA